jgi:hypothetical protein
MLLNFAGACDCALPDVEQFRASANWQTLTVLVTGELQRRQLGRHHGARPALLLAGLLPTRPRQRPDRGFLTPGDCS